MHESMCNACTRQPGDRIAMKDGRVGIFNMYHVGICVGDLYLGGFTISGKVKLVHVACE